MRDAAARTQCVNNLKQLALAYNDWRTVNVGAGYTIMAGGTPQLSSWNASAATPGSLLPYFENNAKTLVCPSVNPLPPQAVVQLFPTGGSSYAGTTLKPTGNNGGAIQGTIQSLYSSTTGAAGATIINATSTDGGDSTCSRTWYGGDSNGYFGAWEFDFGQNYTFDHILFWNGNQGGWECLGAQQLHAAVGSNTVGAAWNTAGVTWTEPGASPFTVSQASGSCPDTNLSNLNMGQVTGSSVLMWNGSQRGGAAGVTWLCATSGGNTAPYGVQIGGVTFWGYAGAGGWGGPYGINDYIGRARRVSNTSGTILFADYKQTVIPSDPDGWPTPTLVGGAWQYSGFSSAFGNVASGIAARHPAEPAIPGGDGSGTQGMVNCAFVDGHVDTLTRTAIDPINYSIGDSYWNNWGANRTD